ncbi:MAG: hypothetical protein K2K58_09355 [Muribaculaceae bacterium]|nr:hypothetical protein [Muribaculaceae bacterium]
MLKESLTENFYNFISDNKDEKTTELYLKWRDKNPDINLDLAITQIECRRKCHRKLSEFIKNPAFIFPTQLSSEQASHQAVSLYHSKLIGKGSDVLDMTAGLGIDSMTIAKAGNNVTACEIDELKGEALSHNAASLNIPLTIEVADSVKFLSSGKTKYDVIFIDPARRDDSQKRVYNFKDCQPDVTSLQFLFRNHAPHILIKASPLLDVSQTLKDLENIECLHIVSINGECKEVLIEIDYNKDHNALSPSFKALDMDNEGNIKTLFEFVDNEVRNNPVYLTDLSRMGYLYEPNASVMKLQPWGILASRYPSLKKFGADSNIFASDELINDFPGRIMQIIKIIDKKNRKAFKG